MQVPGWQSFAKHHQRIVQRTGQHFVLVSLHACMRGQEFAKALLVIHDWRLYLWLLVYALCYHHPIGGQLHLHFQVLCMRLGTPMWIFCIPKYCIQSGLGHCIQQLVEMDLVAGTWVILPSKTSLLMLLWALRHWSLCELHHHEAPGIRLKILLHFHLIGVCFLFCVYIQGRGRQWTWDSAAQGFPWPEQSWGAVSAHILCYVCWWNKAQDHYKQAVFICMILLMMRLFKQSPWYKHEMLGQGQHS